jgi:uncharacterized protein YndB with AHSA1/START domain
VKDAATPRSIVVEHTLPHAPETVWRALTTASLISQWLMPTDFSPEVGAKFTFTTRPMGDWDGIVHCEVVEVTPCTRLRYSWIGGGPTSRLDSMVTWTLTPDGAGTRVRMEHAGFRPQNEMAYAAMSPGWSRIVEQRIGDVIAADAAGVTLPAAACAGDDHG